MAKAALLIGVSDYQSGLQSLAASMRDVEAVRQVLQNPNIGAFAPADITTLLDPDPQQLREALAILFRERQKDDVLLLYFSGHGITDDRGNFYLTCTQTKPELLEATAIPANFVHGLMENSRSKQQIIVLDSCFSGAFASGMGVKGAAVNLAAQLGGQGRAVLTSSSATEYSFEQKEADLSIYTRYWVEGLQTGAADEDENGWISVEELHSYTSRKVREAAPAMKPQIYAAQEGFKIILAKAPVGDPQLEYRKEVERLAQMRKGQLSQILLDALDETRQRLSLSVETAQRIQDEVLEPYRELQKKFQRYEQAVNSALRSTSGLSQTIREDLSYLQQALGLRDADVAAINRKIPALPMLSVKRVLNSWNLISNQPASQQRQNLRSVRRPQPVRQTVHSKNNFAARQRNSKTPILLGSALALGVGGIATTPFLWNSKIEPFPTLRTVILWFKSEVYFFEQGSSKHSKGDYRGAIEDYTEAIRLKPDAAEVYNRRGIAKSNSGDKQGAIEDYTRAIRLMPDDPEAYKNRGNVKRGLGDNQGAIEDYTKAIQLNSDDAFAYSARGLTRASLGDNQGAIEDFNEAILLKPDFPFAYENRGLVKHDLGDNQGAIEDFNEAIQIIKNNALGWAISEPHRIYRNRGLAKHDLGDNQGAIEDFNEAIRLEKDYAFAYHSRALTKAALGDKQGAIADYREAARLYQQQNNIEWYRNALNQIEQLEK